MTIQRIALGVILLAILLSVFVLIVQKKERNADDALADLTIVAPEGDPLEVVDTVYNEWLTARIQDQSNTLPTPVLDKSYVESNVREYSQQLRENGFDPILCQPAVPPRIGTRLLSQTNTSAEVQVLARGLPEKSPHSAVVALGAVDGEWHITDVTCTSGESAPEQEFSFIETGQLLKQVPPPLDNSLWHLVFIQADGSAQVVPLLTEAIACQNTDGTVESCERILAEAAQVTVTGQLEEAGVRVVSIQPVE